MKNVLAYTIWIFFLISCNDVRQSTTNNGHDTSALKNHVSNDPRYAVDAIANCSTWTFDNAKQRADTLIKYMDKTLEHADVKFFCAFPQTFQEMQDLFGYDPKTGAAPLYSYPEGKNVIKYFASLKTIPNALYYKKFIDICIDGVWEADHITECFGFADRLQHDTKAACESLSKRSEQEVRSVFRFIMDGPHPDNEYNDALQQNLIPLLTEQNPKLAMLFSEAYRELMAETDAHRH
ncbi:hypothetical protein GCM10017764_14130 [Sphingobacterium griseoflavum]|uniref:DUF4375 domain-containing protein n=2 Tax=Sphingobacterium griseoflavum TaxID=1474952 RepID=A0ABQ3HT55_9SPHI|nr:hypothetical protein GCM10017764_14130 [Sphingobacterium griseoflavum]